MISNIIYKMTEYFGQDIKRIKHAFKVYGYVKIIAGNEPVTEESSVIIELAAVLHDIGIKEAEKKYNSSSGKYQEKEGPPVARRIMEETGIDISIINRVCFLVGNHHSYEKIDGIDFQILVEADFLVNIDENNIDVKTIKIIKEKHFKTQIGQKILLNLYGV